MEIQIENLKAKMRGVELNSYQKGLALDEFEKLIAHTEALEQQLRQYNVVGRSEQLPQIHGLIKCECGKIYDVDIENNCPSCGNCI